MSDIWRLFIAVELPAALLTELHNIQESLKQDVPPRTVRWVRPEGIHLTLKFLGDVPALRRETLQKALQEAVQGHAAFELTAGGLGCFPSAKRPRVLWIGLQDEAERLLKLRDAVEVHIAPLGYPTEDRPFHPHLTLGRVKRGAKRNVVKQVGALVTSAATPDRYTLPVDGVSLIRSELKPTGAEYTQLFHAPLRA